MPVAVVQAIKSTNASGTSPFTTNSITISAGSALICGVCAFDPGSGPQSITSAVATGSLSLTKQIEFLTSGTDYAGTFFSRPNMSAGSYTVAVTYPHAPTVQTVFLLEASGLATSSEANGTGNKAAGTGTAAASGVMAGVTLTDDLWVALTYSDAVANPAVITAGTGWTIPTNGTETDTVTNKAAAIEYWANPGSTSGNGQFTISTGNWIAVAFAFKAFVAAAVVTPNTVYSKFPKVRMRR